MGLISRVSSRTYRKFIMPKKRKSILKSTNNLFDDSTNIFHGHDETSDLTGLSKNVSFSAKSKVRHIMPVKTLQQEFDMGDGDSDDDSLSFLNPRSQSKKKSNFQISFTTSNSRESGSRESEKSSILKKQPRKNRKSIFARASEEAETEGETDVLGNFQPLPKFDQNAVTKHNKIFDYTNAKPTFKAAMTTDDETDKENTFLNTSNGSGFNSSKVSGSSGTFSFRG